MNIKGRWILICMVLLSMAVSLAGDWPGDKKKVLFPEREHMKKHSEIFFKEVNLTFPPISKVAFFVRTGTYNSAYINLTYFISKADFIKPIYPNFLEKNRELVETFNQTHKAKLTVRNYLEIQKKLNLEKAPVKFYLLLLTTLLEDYQGNRLSGKNAFKTWYILLKLTESAYKQKEKTIERAAILKLSSRMVFFRRAEKWKKKSAKILKKLPPGTTKTPDQQLILSN